jgi:hypothetical protein
MAAVEVAKTLLRRDRPVAGTLEIGLCLDKPEFCTEDLRGDPRKAEARGNFDLRDSLAGTRLSLLAIFGL